MTPDRMYSLSLERFRDGWNCRIESPDGSIVVVRWHQVRRVAQLLAQSALRLAIGVAPGERLPIREVA